MITMVSTAKKLNWSGWLLGIVGAIISGGAGAVASGVGVGYVDPEHFNAITSSGLRHLLSVMGICFVVSALVSLAKFLQSHPVPSPENGPS